MLTIALDESGNFEKDKKYNDLKLIGGVVYKGNAEEEEKKLQEFLRKLAEEVNEKFECNYINPYPAGLHSTENNNKHMGAEITSHIINRVLQYLKKDKNYYVTALIKTKDNSILPLVKGNVIDDRVASNLYERMVIKTIFNNVYYNPEFSDEKDINLKVATRITKVYKDSSEYLEYKKLGYGEGSIDSKNKVTIYVTDIKTFKGAISSKTLEKNYCEKSYNIEVKSINYQQQNNSTFLYLADIICDYIRKIYKSDNELNNINVVKAQVKKDVGNDFIAFFDDDIDILWNKIVDNYNDNRLIEVLDGIYDIRKNKSDIAQYYYNRWVKLVENKLVNDNNIFETKKIRKYIEECKVYFDKTSKELDYEKGIWMFEKLSQIIKIHEVDKLEKYLYEINYTLLGGYNHRGDIYKALQCYDICDKYKNYGVSLINHISLINRVSVIYMNMFNYNKAKEKLDELEPIFETLDVAIGLIANDFGIEKLQVDYIIEKAKVYSSLGQCYSFRKEYNKAKEYFYKSIEIFEERNDLNNAEITKICMLHMFIEQGDIKLYEELAGDIFNSRNLEEQFENIMIEENRFKLFAYVKAAYVFYKKVISLNVIRQLRNFENYKDKFKLEQHPGSLIVKYVTLLLLSNNKYSKEASKFFDKNINCIKEKEYSLYMINATILLDVKNKINNQSKDINDSNNKKAKKLIECAYNNFGNKGYSNIYEYYENIKEYITYSYK